MVDVIEAWNNPPLQSADSLSGSSIGSAFRKGRMIDREKFSHNGDVQIPLKPIIFLINTDTKC